MEVVGEREAQSLEFFTEFGCQALFQFSDGRGVDVLEALAAGVVERRGAHFFQELFDHRADSHDLRRLLDHLGDGLGFGFRAFGGAGGGGLCLGRRHRDGSTVGSDNEYLLFVGVRHASILSCVGDKRRVTPKKLAIE